MLGKVIEGGVIRQLGYEGYFEGVLWFIFIYSFEFYDGVWL